MLADDFGGGKAIHVSIAYPTEHRNEALAALLVA